jgi:hypothetical protein
MATDPIFAATPKVWSGIVPATADASLTAPTNVTTIVTAGASGSKIEQMRISQILTLTGNTTINVFLHDGSTYRHFEGIVLSSYTVSNVIAPTPIDRYYPNLVLPTGWSLRVTVSNTQGQSCYSVTCLGGDF